MIEILVLSVLLILYKTAYIFLPPRFHVFAYMPVDLILSGLVLVWALTYGELTAEKLGLSAGTGILPSVVWGIGGGLLLASVPLAAIWIVRPSVPAMPDEFGGTVWEGLRARLFVCIPFGTVVPEELLFRGIAFQLMLMNWTVATAVVLSSTVFALWHLGPAIRQVVDKAGGSRSTALQPVATILFAFAGGVVLAVSAWQTSSLLAPVIAHGMVNIIAVLAVRGMTPRPH